MTYMKIAVIYNISIQKLNNQSAADKIIIADFVNLFSFTILLYIVPHRVKQKRQITTIQLMSVLCGVSQCIKYK